MPGPHENNPPLNSDVYLQVVQEVTRALVVQQVTTQELARSLDSGLRQLTTQQDRHQQELSDLTTAVNGHRLAVEARTEVVREGARAIASALQSKMFVLVVGISFGLGLQGAYKLVQAVLSSVQQPPAP